MLHTQAGDKPPRYFNATALGAALSLAARFALTGNDRRRPLRTGHHAWDRSWTSAATRCRITAATSDFAISGSGSGGVVPAQHHNPVCVGAKAALGPGDVIGEDKVRALACELLPPRS